MRRKLIVEEWLSLDGYATDKAGKLDFFAPQVKESYTTEQRRELLNSIDTILFGRKTYELFSALWPERDIEQNVLAAKINTLPKVVCTQTLTKASWGKWPEATIEAGDPAEKIKALLAKPGKNIVVWGSIQLAQTLMAADLVDELHLHLCPVLNGGGRKFFNEQATAMTLLSSHTLPNGTVPLKYCKPTKN